MTSERKVTVTFTTRPLTVGSQLVDTVSKFDSGLHELQIRVVSTNADADIADDLARDTFRGLRDRIDELLGDARDGAPDVDANEVSPVPPVPDNPILTAYGLSWLIYNRRGSLGSLRRVFANPWWLLVDIDRNGWTRTTRFGARPAPSTKSTTAPSSTHRCTGPTNHDRPFT
jgi:hypothetical protein